LVGVLGYGIFKEYLSVMRLKNIDTLQERGSVLKKNPTIDVVAYAKEIIERYENHENELIRENALSLKRELPSLMYDEVIDRLNEKLFNPLDKLAKGSIIKYANQTALSTAISPVAFIDAILIISRSGAMVNEIATIYGYKPNFIGKILLFKKIFFVLVFASVTEILAQHSHDLVGTSIVSKFSYHAAQGIANGILTARVGVAAIKSCRPMHYKDQNEGFLKGISKKIMESVFKFGGSKK
jgi:putative membrane protein